MNSLNTEKVNSDDKTVGVETRRRSKRLRFLSGILALAPAAIAMSPGLASAQYCPSGKVCLWKHHGWSGPYARFKTDQKSYKSNTFTDGSGIGDQISSLCNNTGYQVRFYKHRDFKGAGFYLKSGWCLRDLQREGPFIPCTINGKYYSNCGHFGDALSSHDIRRPSYS